MQITRKRCFKTRKYNMTLCQVKKGKHECNFCYFSTLLMNYFSSMKGFFTFIWSNTIVTRFLHLMILIYKIVISYNKIFFGNIWQRKTFLFMGILIIMHNKIQHLSLTFPGWTISNQTKGVIHSCVIWFIRTCKSWFMHRRNVKSSVNISIWCYFLTPSAK